MRDSIYENEEELLLFLKAETAATVPGIYCHEVPALSQERSCQKVFTPCQTRSAVLACPIKEKISLLHSRSFPLKQPRNNFHARFDSQSAAVKADM